MTTVTDDFKILAHDRGFGEFTLEKEGNWTGDFTFIQAADTQLGMIDSYVNRNHGPDASWAIEIELCQEAVAAINRLTPVPRFIVVCGDLVDAMPGVSNKSAQIADFKKVFAKLRPEIKLVCVCGNHDIGDVPTSDAIAQYKRDFGDDYFSFWVGGCKFVVLNSQFYHNCTLVQEEAKAHEQWLESQLFPPKSSTSSAPWAHLIGLQHIPPFVSEPDEAPVEVPGNPILNFNFADKAIRKVFLAQLKRSGMKKLFCGHYHRNAGGFDDDLEVIVTSAVGCQLGSDQHGLRIVSVRKEEIEHKYYALSQLPSSCSHDS